MLFYHSYDLVTYVLLHKIVDVIESLHQDTLQHNTLSLNRRCAMDIWTCTSFSLFNTYASWMRLFRTFLLTTFGSANLNHNMLHITTPFDFIQCINDLIIKKNELFIFITSTWIMNHGFLNCKEMTTSLCNNFRHVLVLFIITLKLGRITTSELADNYMKVFFLKKRMKIYVLVKNKIMWDLMMVNIGGRT